MMTRALVRLQYEKYSEFLVFIIGADISDPGHGDCEVFK